MTISDLASYVAISPNRYAGRAFPVSKVTVHHMAGDLSVEACGRVFANPSRQASSNYGVGSDGRIACYVYESDTAWTSSSYGNDSRAITIEVADEDTAAWAPSQAAYDATVRLVADICLRYGIDPHWDGTPGATLTEHRMFSATSCPGPWWHEALASGRFERDVGAAMRGEYGKEEKRPEEGKMSECLIIFDDDHCGYFGGDVVYWSPAAGFCYLEHPDCVNILNDVHAHDNDGRGLHEVHSGAAYPWAERLRQATNPKVAAETFGKRD